MRFRCIFACVAVAAGLLSPCLGRAQDAGNAITEPELPPPRAPGAAKPGAPAAKPSKAGDTPQPAAGASSPIPPKKSAQADDFEALGVQQEPGKGAAQPLELPAVAEAKPQKPSAARSAGSGSGDAFADKPVDSAEKRDGELFRTQSPARPGAGVSGLDSTLPPASEPPGGLPPNTPTGPVGDPFLLPADRLMTGPQTVGLRVEVVSPEFANLSLESEFWIKVTNVGPNDASGVMVRYPLPKDVEYVSSEPEAARNDGSLILWQLNTLSSRGEKIIKVKVRPRAKGAIDHAVTVTMMAGGRARTMVRQPQLQIDIRADKPKPMKGETVVFDIDVNNVGDHPARDVIVNALLSGGLKHPAGQELKLALKKELGVSSIPPGEKVSLKLEAETTAMGPQTCNISLTSRDIVEDVKKQIDIDVVNPNLELTIAGPSERHPDSRVRYTINVRNSGTASARNVLVAANVPREGSPQTADPKPTWNPEKRRMDWAIGELHPGDERTFTIEVKMGRVGLFTLSAATTYEGLAQSIKASHSTDIRGIPRLVLSVTEPRGVLDEGEESVYEIRIRNDGSKEATSLIVQGKVTENMRVLGLEGSDQRGSNPPPQDERTAVFPLIERLPPGGEVTMAIRVKALAAGDATCQVTVGYSDYQGTGGPSQTVVTKVTPSSHRQNP